MLFSNKCILLLKWDVRLASRRGEHPSGCRERRCLAIARIPGAFSTAFWSSHASGIPAQMFIFLCSPNHFRLPILFMFVYPLGYDITVRVMWGGRGLLEGKRALAVARQPLSISDVNHLVWNTHHTLTNGNKSDHHISLDQASLPFKSRLKADLPQWESVSNSLDWGLLKAHYSASGPDWGF